MYGKVSGSAAAMIGMQNIQFQLIFGSAYIVSYLLCKWTKDGAVDSKD